jgi:Holliday junction resolvase
MRKMLEQEIEQQLVRAVKKMGGRAVKFMSPGFDGMPDRLVLLPGGKCGFVEVKAPGKKPRALQVVRHEMLKTWGFKVYVADAKEQIEEIINDICGA